MSQSLTITVFISILDYDIIKYTMYEYIYKAIFHTNCRLSFYIWYYLSIKCEMC